MQSCLLTYETLCEWLLLNESMSRTKPLVIVQCSRKGSAISGCSVTVGSFLYVHLLVVVWGGCVLSASGFSINCFLGFRRR